MLTTQMVEAASHNYTGHCYIGHNYIGMLTTKMVEAASKAARGDKSVQTAVVAWQTLLEVRHHRAARSVADPEAETAAL